MIISFSRHVRCKRRFVQLKPTFAYVECYFDKGRFYEPESQFTARLQGPHALLLSGVKFQHSSPKNSITSICCRFVLQQLVYQFCNKCRTSCRLQRVYNIFTSLYVVLCGTVKSKTGKVTLYYSAL